MIKEWERADSEEHALHLSREQRFRLDFIEEMGDPLWTTEPSPLGDPIHHDGPKGVGGLRLTEKSRSNLMRMMRLRKARGTDGQNKDRR